MHMSHLASLHLGTGFCEKGLQVALSHLYSALSLFKCFAYLFTTDSILYKPKEFGLETLNRLHALLLALYGNFESVALLIKNALVRQ